MANPNDITRRSDKDTFLTFEEMDLNLDVLKDLVIDYNNIYNTILPGLTDRVGDVEQDLSDYKVEVNTRFNGVVSTIEENTFTREQIFTDKVQMTSTFIADLTVNTTFRLPRWKNNTRPNNPLYGVFGYNSDLNNLEFFDGNVWNTLRDPAATENEAKAGSSVSFRRWSPKLIRDAIIGWWESIIKQTTGQSTTDVMSQKAVTDKLNNMSALLEIPRGIITMFSGLVEEIPTGWSLCDGTNGTPNLLNRFIVAAGDEYEVGDTGDGSIPSHSHGAGTLSASSAGAHTHSASSNSTGAHTHNVYKNNGSGSSNNLTQITGARTQLSGAVVSAGAHSHTVTVNSDGAHGHTISGSTAASGSGTEVIAKYYALAYIMKL